MLRRKNKDKMPEIVFCMPYFLWFFSLLILIHSTVKGQDFHVPWKELHKEIHHLGIPGFPEWDDYSDRTAEGRDLTLTLAGLNTTNTSTLLIFQKDVKERWELKMNGHSIGNLFPIEQSQVTAFSIAPEWLDPIENIFTVHAPKAVDDIEIGDLRWHPDPVEIALDSATVHVEVLEEATLKSIPCRITIVDERNALFPVHPMEAEKLTVRPGVLYSGNGKVTFGLSEGNYQLFASRGFEYSVARYSLKVTKGLYQNISLTIKREVDTEGWIASDTHIHTRTFSGHGDAMINESMLSIAGEGIELAVATDHNHHTDFAESAQSMAVDKEFTSVIGNEVTTKVGHFNAFPVLPDSPLPDHNLTHWGELMSSMRKTPGVRVIVLNHPRNIHSQFSPMASKLFDQDTGIHKFASALTFDAMELVTSAALQTDLLKVYRDWFALLNRGHRLVGVGSSDTHDISRYILGQGRSYLRVEDSDPSQISIEEACNALLDGRVLISMGLWVNMQVMDTFEVGDTVDQLPELIPVDIQVQGPSWVAADEVCLYLNGKVIRRQSIAPHKTPIEKVRIRWNIPKPTKNSYLVAIAQGPGVTEPFWVIPRPYQHKSIHYTPRVIGSTNPIWLSVD